MPNTPDRWEITVTLEDERAAFWQGVLGTDTVPIVSPVPQHCRLPGLGARPCLMLDLNAITQTMREHLIVGIAERFGLPAEEVARDIEQHGVPILFEDVHITCADQGLMLSVAEMGAELAQEADGC